MAYPWFPCAPRCGPDRRILLTGSAGAASDARCRDVNDLSGDRPECPSRNVKNKFQADVDHHMDVIINTFFTDIQVFLHKFVSEPNKTMQASTGPAPPASYVPRLPEDELESEECFIETAVANRKHLGKKLVDPLSLKPNEHAQRSFQPQQPLICDTFKSCEGLSRGCWRRPAFTAGRTRRS